MSRLAHFPSTLSHSIGEIPPLERIVVRFTDENISPALINVLATITLKTKKFSLITKFQQKIGSKYGALPSIKIEEIK